MFGLDKVLSAALLGILLQKYDVVKEQILVAMYTLLGSFFIRWRADLLYHSA